METRFFVFVPVNHGKREGPKLEPLAGKARGPSVHDLHSVRLLFLPYSAQ